MSLEFGKNLGDSCTVLQLLAVVPDCRLFPTVRTGPPIYILHNPHPPLPTSLTYYTTMYVKKGFVFWLHIVAERKFKTNVSAADSVCSQSKQPSI